MNKFITAIVIMVLLNSCSDKKQDPNLLTITGTIKGLKKGKIYIQRVQDTNLIALDTIYFNGNSNFESTIKLNSPEMLYLFLDRGVSNSLDNNLLFFAEPGKMNISTDLELFLANAKITGSKNHELYTNYKEIISKFNQQQLELLKEEIMAKKNNKDISAEIAKKDSSLIKRKYLYAINYAVNNANYEIAPYIAITDIHDANIRFLDTIKKSMSPKVAQSKYGKKLIEYIAELKNNK